MFCLTIGPRCVWACIMLLCEELFTHISQGIISEFFAIIRQKNLREPCCSINFSYTALDTMVASLSAIGNQLNGQPCLRCSCFHYGM